MTMTPAPLHLAWRRILLLAVTVASMAALLAPAVTMAAAPSTVVDTTYGTKPGRLATDAGTVDFFVFFSDVNGPVAELFYWKPGQVPGLDPAIQGIEGPTIGAENDVVTGDFWTWDSATQEPMGLATYVLAFRPTGDPTTEHTVRRDGNVRIEQTVTRQRMTVEGTITLADGTVIPISATGQKDVFETRSTSPAALVDSGTQTSVHAAWTVGGHEVIFAVIESAIASEALVLVLEDVGEVAGLAYPKFVDGRLLTEVELVRAIDQQKVGTATVELSVTPVGSRSWFSVSPSKRLRYVEEELAVTGSLTLTIDGVTTVLDFTDADVMAQTLSWHGAQRPYKGDDGGGGGEG